MLVDNCCRLCIAILKLLRFNSDNESLFGMFDGGRNSDVPKLVIKNIANVLKEEMKCHESANDFMKYTMLTMHRSAIHLSVCSSIFYISLLDYVVQYMLVS